MTKRISKKMLDDAGFPDTPTARAILSRMLDDDDDIQVYQRPWVGLTDREKSNLWLESRAAIPRFYTYAGLVEAKLKEKNT